VELCVVLAVSTGIFYHLLKKARANVNELRAALKMNKNGVERYEDVLAKELQRTKQRLRVLLSRERLPDEAMLVTRLRASFLSAEQYARTYRENQEAFWKALEDGLKDIVALAKLKVEKTAGAEKEAWQQKLDAGEKKINELEMLRGTFSAPLEAVTDARAQAEEIAHLREVNAQHITRIEKLIADIAALRSASIQAELPSQKKEETLPDSSSHSPAPVFIRSIQEVRYAQAAMGDTLEQIDTYQANSAREIKRLKEMCLEQRSIIKKLREQLKHQGGDASADQSDTGEQQTDNIERLLRDAEMCVQTLEQENANLQSEITTLRAQVNVPSEPVDAATDSQLTDNNSEKGIEYFHKQIQQLRGRIREQDEVIHLNQQLRAYVIKAIECRTSQAMLELLIATLNQFQLSGCLQTKENGQSIAATFGSKIDNKDSNLLNSIVVDKAITALVDTTIYAFPPLKMLIKSGDLSRDSLLGIDHIIELAEVSAMQFDMLASNEGQRLNKQERQQFITTMRKSLNNIKIQLKYQEDESKRITTTMAEDIKIALSLSSILDEEEKRVLEVTEEAGKRLQLLFNSGSLIEKSISGIVRSLDRMAA
jgi:hypothetical protein